MYSSVKLGIKFIRYWFPPKNGKGMAFIPFLFLILSAKYWMTRANIIITIPLNSCGRICWKTQPCLNWKTLARDRRMHGFVQRRINEIALSSLKPRKFARLFLGIVNHYQPWQRTGIGNLPVLQPPTWPVQMNKKPVTTMKVKELLLLAVMFKRLGLKNVFFHYWGNWPGCQFIKTAAKVDFVYVDGNHRKEPIEIFWAVVLKNSAISFPSLCLMMQLSSEMEATWDLVKAHSRVNFDWTCFCWDSFF